MTAQIWRTTVDNNYPIPAAGSALASSVTLTDVSPGGTTQTIISPANKLNNLGTVLELEAFGTFSNTGTPTLLLGFYYGGVAGTALAATGAVTTTTGATNWPWRMRARGIIRAGGQSGTIMMSGELLLATSLTAFTSIPIPATALATVTIDTTTAKALTTGAQWGTNSASNTLTCHFMSAEIL